MAKPRAALEPPPPEEKEKKPRPRAQIRREPGTSHPWKVRLKRKLPNGEVIDRHARFLTKSAATDWIR